MKKNIIVCFILFISLNTKANPVVEHFISELLFVDGVWQLELTNIYGDLNGASLITKTDTAGFREGIDISSNFIVIEQKDLLDELKIDQAGDTLWLKGAGYSDIIYWGNSALVAVPIDGQSICAESYFGSYINYYLDNTPTIGTENDTLNAQGYVEGFVTDIYDNPLADVKVIYHSDSFDESYANTNSLGYFRLKNISKINKLKFRKPGYENTYKSIQIYPEQTVSAATIRLIHKPQELGFYPLAIGNRWVYESSGHWSEIFYGSHLVYYWSYPLSLEIINSAVIDGINVFQIEYTTYNYYLEKSDTNYIYETNYFDKCKIYSSDHSFLWPHENLLKFDLCSNPGDSVQHTFFDYGPTNTQVSLLHDTDSTDILFDNNTHFKIFKRKNDFEMYTQKLAQGFGLVEQYYLKYDNAWESHQVLKGCIIDGVVYGDTSLIVSVEDEEESLPNEISLSQNYPNPFNPTTKIKFSIHHSQFATLKVYDILGREIKTLLNKPMQPGSYEVEFDGNDLPTGVYFYRLSAGDLVEARKMLLIK